MGITLQAIDNASTPQNITTPNGVPTVDVTSVSTQRYFPRKVEHTLMSGNMTTYTPNHKTQLIIAVLVLEAKIVLIILKDVHPHF